VWRELRRTGAVPLGQGSWAVPDANAFADGIDRAVEMAERGGGEIVVLSAAGRSERDAARLAELFTAERNQEWAEFLADCAKFDAEIDHEISQGKFTLAELEEEEQSLERLRRWHRTIKTRDLFGAPAAAEAEQQLKHCGERLAEYTEQVFAALHQI
jgi:sugar phosphate isomerase/epimerase